MRANLLLFFAFLAPVAHSQTAPATPLAPLNFLLGTWSAQTGPKGSAGAQSFGNYTFRTDLNGTVITRTGSPDSCVGPATFDCQHHDFLTIYRDAGDSILHALYLDNEGHTIHYNLTFPDATTAVFLSNTPGPQFKLTYHLEGGVMSGKFQFAPPGSTTFTSYLEWSGQKASPK